MIKLLYYYIIIIIFKRWTFQTAKYFYFNQNHKKQFLYITPVLPVVQVFTRIYVCSWKAIASLITGKLFIFKKTEKIGKFNIKLKPR